MHDQPNIDNPVFVIGTGRCGISPLMRLIAYHRAFAWPSQFNQRHPKNYKISFFSRLVDLPLINSSPVKYRKFPVHFEAFKMWENIFLGFSRPFRDLRADDVTNDVRSKFRYVVSEIMKYQGKPRFIAEYSGWSRIAFMKAIFPAAKFIHIVRDGRAFANSVMTVKWWQGWEGVYKWRWGVPNRDLMAKLEKYDHSFLALAAIQWKILVNNILAESSLLSDKEILLVRYEDMVESPNETASRCMEFCGLDKDCPRFKKHLSTVKMVNANQQKFRIPAWQANLNQKQIDMLNDLLKDELAHFDYLPSHSADDRQRVLIERVADLEPSNKLIPEVAEDSIRH